MLAYVRKYDLVIIHYRYVVILVYVVQIAFIVVEHLKSLGSASGIVSFFVLNLQDRSEILALVVHEIGKTSILSDANEVVVLMK